MLVFVSDSEKEMVQAAVHAAKHGFARTATLDGGLQALDCIDTQKVSSKTEAWMRILHTMVNASEKCKGEWQHTG